MFFKPTTPIVPRTFPPISFLTLQDYIKSLSYTAYWPLDDVVNNPFNRVINPAVAKGRQLALTPDFATDTNWTKGTGWTISGGVAAATAVVTGAVLSPTTAILQLSRAYEIIYDIVVTIGSARVESGTGALGTTRSVSGTYTETLICTTTTALRFNAVTTFTGTIDNISVKEINIPANDAVPIQLLADGDGEGSVGAWTAIASAIITHQTGSPHSGTNVIRVARNGVTTPCMAQTILDTTKVQRIIGVCRSGDGLAVPIVRHGTTTIFTGTASQDWQPFDLIVIPTATDVRFGSTTNTGTQFVEFDDLVVTLDTGIRQNTVIENGDFENNLVSWASSGGASLSIQTATPFSGTKYLRVTFVSGTNNNAQHAGNPLVIGKRYRVTGVMRGDGGSGLPDVRTASAVIQTGTTSTTWQTIDRVFICTNVLFRLNNASNTGFVEFDNITIVEVSSLVAAPNNGVVLGNSESNRLLVSASFDGSNDNINPYSSELNSIFSLDEGTLLIFAKVANSNVWTDGSGRQFIRFEIDANNVVSISKSSTNNRITYSQIAGGTSKTINLDSISTTDWMCVAITWSKSADQVIAYFNGSQVTSPSTGLGQMVGNLSATFTTIGARGGTLVHFGSLSNALFCNTVLSVDQISEISKLGDAN